MGVKNDPRRFAALFGRMAVPISALVVVSVFAICVLAGLTGAKALIALGFALGWAGVTAVLAIRTANRAPIVVVRVNARGANQAIWLVMAPFLPVVASALLIGTPLVIAPVGLSLIMALIVWRARARIPEMVRELHPLLAPDEAVLGDGIGLVGGARKRPMPSGWSSPRTGVCSSPAHPARRRRFCSWTRPIHA